MIPPDVILKKGKASVDYSFVSGEITPLEKVPGELIYARGIQSGNNIELEVVNEVSQSYITQLWNNDVFRSNKNCKRSFIHPWSRYFTLALFSIALGAVVFWWIKEPANIFPVLTSVLLVACPCSLLLSATFTYGNMLRIFGKNKLYLKNAGIIEAMSRVNTLVFDKTGTITQCHLSSVVYQGIPLNETENAFIKKLAGQSSHPLSKIIAAGLPILKKQILTIEQYKEYAGEGIEALVNKVPVKLGSALFIALSDPDFISYDMGSHVHLSINDVHLGRFSISSQYREGLHKSIEKLKADKYQLYLLSGDNDTEKNNLQHLFGKDATIKFQQTPQQKLDYIKKLQQGNKNVLMLGDGLNDAGALMQSNIGIAVSDNSARFTPACDAILDGNHVNRLHQFLAFARSGKKIITASFILSILYNIVGLSFAVSAGLSPLVAAILMPASSISIVLFVTLLSNIAARRKGL